MTKTDTSHQNPRLEQIVSLAFNGISIHNLKVIPNRWDGFDLDLEDNRSLRITIECGQIEVYTFDGYNMESKATFDISCPALAVAAYYGALVR